MYFNPWNNWNRFITGLLRHFKGPEREKSGSDNNRLAEGHKSGAPIGAMRGNREDKGRLRLEIPLSDVDVRHAARGRVFKHGPKPQMVDPGQMEDTGYRAGAGGGMWKGAT